MEEIEFILSDNKDKDPKKNPKNPTNASLILYLMISI